MGHKHPPKIINLIFFKNRGTYHQTLISYLVTKYFYTKTISMNERTKTLIGIIQIYSNSQENNKLG